SDDPMIVSFTPNPAVDKTLFVRGLKHGDQNRADQSYVDPGGKGINVSRMAHRLGVSTVALAVLGGHVGRMPSPALHDQGSDAHFARTHEETRLNFILVDPESGESTRVWDRGPPADESTTSEALDLVKKRIVGASVFVTGGTALPGMPADVHATALALARDAG